MRLGAIHLRNKDIKKELIDRAQFIFWAAGGAMGDGGAFEIVTDDGRAYYCNCVYGDADPDLILEACPLIRDDAQDSGLWEGWVFHYLGEGPSFFSAKNTRRNTTSFLAMSSNMASGTI